MGALESDGQAVTCITEEMILRGCKAVQEIGGIAFNPHLPLDQCSYSVEQVLSAALGLALDRS
jgi:hypothetical protein